MKHILATILCCFAAFSASAQENRYFSTPTTAPVGPRGYGWLGNPTTGARTGSGLQYHVGIDYIGTLNSAITAAGSGRVVAVYNNGSGDHGLGNTIIIQHSLAASTFSLYGHLNSIDPQVSVGKYVTKGQLIGAMGMTGTGSGNVVHLHFEMKNSNSLSNSLGTYGYTPSTTTPSNAGYLNPNDYIGRIQYGDFTLTSANPTLARVGAGLIAKPTIANPFGQASIIDMRLRVLSSTGAVIKDIATIYSQTMAYSGSMGFTLSTTSHGLSAGAYKLQMVYKAANSTTWFVLPYGTASNPWTLTVTN